VVAPGGIGVTEYWSSLLSGRSAVGPVTLFNAGKLRIRTAAEVRNFDPHRHLPPDVKWRRLARHTCFTLAALEEALADARLDAAFLTPSRHVFVVAGVGTSALELMELAADRLRDGHHDRMEPWIVTSSQPNAVTVAMAARLGTKVSSTTISTDCVSGLDAVCAAAEAVRSGRVEMAVAAGADAPITPSTFASFGVLPLLSERNDDPAHASRPFDRDRDGGVLGEGAGVVVLESLAHARARGARPWIEICGGASCPDPAGSPAGTGLALSMEMALANACRAPADMDYICAHGPSHPVIDRTETAAIRRLFGRRADAVPVSSIKGVIGNPLAAAGPLQVIACALAMRHGLVPPTANYTTPDPACDLDYVPQARRLDVRRALTNVHGVGGGNSTLVVARPEP
jgi:minimal PKS ketosynthase (KS/KS alpha)